MFLSKGPKIVLTSNIWSEAKLVNEEDKFPPDHQPAFIVCNFPAYVSPSFLPNSYKLVPLVAV